VNKIFIISPSGNFYGSEQVLFDFVTSTSLETVIAVPRKSKLDAALQAKSIKSVIVNYDNNRLLTFYLRLMLSLAARRFKTVYLNEGGHSKYILLLSKIFRRVKFVIHIRLIEDTDAARWLFNPGKNVELISISTFIKNRMHFESRLLADPYMFNSYTTAIETSVTIPLRIGIIGRVSYSKGFQYLTNLLLFLKRNQLQQKFVFYLFGDIAADVRSVGGDKELNAFENVVQMGFVDAKTEIYSNIDCVMHLSDREPLGRIFFEAIDYVKPLIGINAGGIGEIGNVTGLTELLVNCNERDISAQLVSRLEQVNENYKQCCANILKSKSKASEIYSISKYTSTMEEVLTG
jgi:glycosyltransferase involved in cell wall biosynthesis